MAKIIEPNYDMIFRSAVTEKKLAYQEYKATLIAMVQATWIDDDGGFVELKSNYRQKHEEALKRYNKASIEVEHYRQYVKDGEQE